MESARSGGMIEMGQVERLGAWVLNGASGTGPYRIPINKSMYQDVDLTGVSTMTFEYASAGEGWSHLYIQIDGVNLKGFIRDRQIYANRSCTLDYTGVHRITLTNTNTVAVLIRNISALATVDDVPIISDVSFPDRYNHGHTIFRLFGAGFVSGMIVKLRRAGHPDLVCDIIEILDGAVDCRADLLGLTPGGWKPVIEYNGQMAEAETETVVEESCICPAMMVKREKNDAVKMNMEYSVNGARIKIRGMK